jgi:hypothetical protein
MDEVDNVILGLSFLTQHVVSWSFNDNSMNINGEQHELHYIPARPSCRRVFVNEPISISPCSQVTIQAKVPFRSLTETKDAYLLDTTEPSSGLFVARTLLPSTSVICQLTACNTRSSELYLYRNVRRVGLVVRALDSRPGDPGSSLSSATQADS